MELAKTEDVREEDIVYIKCPKVSRTEVLPRWCQLPLGHNILSDQPLEGNNWLINYLGVHIFIDSDSNKYLNKFSPIQAHFLLAFQSFAA